MRTRRFDDVDERARVPRSADRTDRSIRSSPSDGLRALPRRVVRSIVITIIYRICVHTYRWTRCTNIYGARPGDSSRPYRYVRIGITLSWHQNRRRRNPTRSLLHTVLWNVHLVRFRYPNIITMTMYGDVCRKPVDFRSLYFSVLHVDRLWELDHFSQPCCLVVQLSSRFKLNDVRGIHYVCVRKARVFREIVPL